MFNYIMYGSLYPALGGEGQVVIDPHRFGGHCSKIYKQCAEGRVWRICVDDRPSIFDIRSGNLSLASTRALPSWADHTFSSPCPPNLNPPVPLSMQNNLILSVLVCPGKDNFNMFLYSSDPYPIEELSGSVSVLSDFKLFRSTND